MPKKLLLILFALTLVSIGVVTPALSRMGSNWSVEVAKKELFQDVLFHIDLSKLPPLPQTDPYWETDKAVITKGGGRIDNRVITVFENGTYGLAVLCSKTVYYFSPLGKLGAFEVRSSPAAYTDTCMPHYPTKAWKYTAKGDLLDLSLAVSATENFAFQPEGTLTSHWVDGQCYNEKGAACGKRSVYNESAPRRK